MSTGPSYAPKFFSRKPQSTSENRQYNSKSGSDQTLIFVSGVCKPAEADEDGSVEGGAVFFGFLGICGLAGLLSYWMTSK